MVNKHIRRFSAASFSREVQIITFHIKTHHILHLSIYHSLMSICVFHRTEGSNRNHISVVVTQFLAHAKPLISMSLINEGMNKEKQRALEGEKRKQCQFFQIMEILHAVGRCHIHV